MTTSSSTISDPRVERQTRAFLEALNASDGKPIEMLQPDEGYVRTALRQAAAELKLRLK